MYSKGFEKISRTIPSFDTSVSDMRIGWWTRMRFTFCNMYDRHVQESSFETTFSTLRLSIRSQQQKEKKQRRKDTGLNDLSVIPPLRVASTVYCMAEMCEIRQFE